MQGLIAREELPRTENVRLGGRGVRAGRVDGAIASGFAKTTFGEVMAVDHLASESHPRSS